MTKRRNRLSDEYRSLTRQTQRDYSVVASQDTENIHMLKVKSDIQPGSMGYAYLQLPVADEPYWVDSGHTVELYLQEGQGDLKTDVYVLAFWSAAAGCYIPFAVGQGGGGESFLAKATDKIPGRVDDTTPGTATVQPVKIDSATGKFVDDGDPVTIYSWVGSPSADPADDSKGYIYVWIERAKDANLYWTGEDCVVEDQTPVTEETNNYEIQDTDNTVIIS